MGTNQNWYSQIFELIQIFCLFLDKSLLQEAEVQYSIKIILFLFDAITFKIVIKNNIAFEFMPPDRKCYHFLSRKIIKVDTMKYILVMVVQTVFYFQYFTFEIHLNFQVNLFKMNTLSISAHSQFISIHRSVRLQVIRSVLGKSP